MAMLERRIFGDAFYDIDGEHTGNTILWTILCWFQHRWDDITVAIPCNQFLRFNSTSLFYMQSIDCFLIWVGYEVQLNQTSFMFQSTRKKFTAPNGLSQYNTHFTVDVICFLRKTLRSILLDLQSLQLCTMTHTDISNYYINAKSSTIQQFLISQYREACQEVLDSLLNHITLDIL